MAQRLRGDAKPWAKEIQGEVMKPFHLAETFGFLFVALPVVLMLIFNGSPLSFVVWQLFGIGILLLTVGERIVSAISQWKPPSTSEIVNNAAKQQSAPLPQFEGVITGHAISTAMPKYMQKLPGETEAAWAQRIADIEQAVFLAKNKP